MNASIGIASYTYDIGDLVLGCWWSTHFEGIVRDLGYRMFGRVVSTEVSLLGGLVE